MYVYYLPIHGSGSLDPFIRVSCVVYITVIKTHDVQDSCCTILPQVPSRGPKGSRLSHELKKL